MVPALFSVFLGSICLFQANINADIFHTKLPAGCVIVMDNASCKWAQLKSIRRKSDVPLKRFPPIENQFIITSFF